jgi:hypothetical protein
MELAKTKIPYLPPDWTVARGARYVAKFGVFILVPGLHQIACNRWILGGLIFALYGTSSFVISNSPIEHGVTSSIPIWPLVTIDVARYFSWSLLFIDVGQQESRKLRPWYLSLVACIGLLHTLPLHSQDILFLHVVSNKYDCDDYCANDVFSYEMFIESKDEVSIDDLILVKDFSISVEDFGRHYFPARVVMTRISEPCFTDFPLDMHARLDFYFCVDGKRDYFYDFLVVGGPKTEYVTPGGQSVTPLPSGEIEGFNLKKIGNTHKYFILTEEITEFTGNALLAIYKWTGINLL